MKERLYYLDTLRGLLMMGGVVLHTAYIFSSGHVWIIGAENTSVVVYYLVQFIHYFRMPAFFVVSGFFCLMTLQRYGGRIFLRVRAKRILIPLVVTALTLNVVQRMVLKDQNLSSLELDEYVTEGRWVSHLWFLNLLMLYFFAAAVFFSFGRHAVVKRLSQFRVPTGHAGIVLVLLLVPVYAIGLRVVNKLVPLDIELLNVVEAFQLLYYFQFFIFGCWLFSRPSMMTRFVSLPLMYSICLALLAVVVYKIWGSSESYAYMLLREYSRMVFIWCSIACCFGLFYRLASRKSMISHYLSEASYSVYLFHHLLVVMLAPFFMQIDARAELLVILMSASIFCLSMIIHLRIIARYPVMRYLFNGK